MSCPDANLYALMFDGRLDDRDRGSIETHLDRCDRCSAMVSELAWVLSPLRDEPDRYKLIARLDGPHRWLAIDRTTGLTRELRFVAATPARSELAARCATPRAHVVTIEDAGTLGDELYFVTAPITIVTATGVDAALELWLAVLSGLEQLHSAGIVHGSITAESAQRRDGAIELGGIGRLSTPMYTAPEVLSGRAATFASDQFSFAACLWHAGFGSPPFEGTSPGALVIAMATPPPLSEPTKLRAALRRALAYDPDDRWPDLAQLRRALRRSDRDAPR